MGQYLKIYIYKGGRDEGGGGESVGINGKSYKITMVLQDTQIHHSSESISLKYISKDYRLSFIIIHTCKFIILNELLADYISLRTITNTMPWIFVICINIVFYIMCLISHIHKVICPAIFSFILIRF